MNDFTIAIYCFVDDYLCVAGEKPAVRRKLSDAEMITTALLAARYFGGNMTHGPQLHAGTPPLPHAAQEQLQPRSPPPGGEEAKNGSRLMGELLQTVNDNGICRHFY